MTKNKILFFIGMLTSISLQAGVDLLSLKKHYNEKTKLWEPEEKKLTDVALGGDLTKWNFSGAEFNGAHFDGAGIFDSQFVGATLKNLVVGGRGAVITSSNFTKADLSNAKIRAAFEVTRSPFVEASFRHAELYDVSFSQSDLRGIDFSDTSLKKVAFYMLCNLQNAKFQRAHFQDSRLGRLIGLAEKAAAGAAGRTIEKPWKPGESAASLAS